MEPLIPAASVQLLVQSCFWEELSCCSPVLEGSRAAVLSLFPPVAAVYAKGAAICA